MPYQDVNGDSLSPAQNPYTVSGDAASIISKDYSPKLVYTKFIKDILNEVEQSLKIRNPMNLFLVGEYGYGKTTLLHLIAQKFNQRDGICIPIKFQEIVTPVAASSQPDQQFESLLGAILLKIYDCLVKEGVLSKSDRALFKDTELINLFDAFFELLKRTDKMYILIAFDEVEALFSNLSINIGYFLSFLQSLSEKFKVKPTWSLCVSVTEDYYSQIISEARQLQEARFNFKFLNPLPSPEVREYIETKNSSVTLRTNDKIYPFEDEVIDFILAVSGGIPRFLETICQLIWAEAEANHSSINLETARRIFSNTYRVYAESYFSELCVNNQLSEEVRPFLNLLFFSGGRRQSIQDLLILKDHSPIDYFYGLSGSQAKYRLDKASKELRSKLESGFEQYLEVFGKNPYRYTLPNSVFRDIFRARERL